MCFAAIEKFATSGFGTSYLVSKVGKAAGLPKSVTNILSGTPEKVARGVLSAVGQEKLARQISPKAPLTNLLRGRPEDLVAQTTIGKYKDAPRIGLSDEFDDDGGILSRRRS